MAPRSALRRSSWASVPLFISSALCAAWSVLNIGLGGTEAKADFKLPTENDCGAQKAGGERQARGQVEGSRCGVPQARGYPAGS